MACPRGYVEIVLNKRRLPASIPSERGRDIHRVMALYYEHCAKLRVRSDWNYFDQIAVNVGHDDAGPILDGIRDFYECEWERFYAAELTMALTEEFNPAPLSKVEGIPGVEYEDKDGWAAYIGTLDVLLLSEDGERAKIPDYKSHPAIFDADTFQSVEYSLFVFKHFPKVKQVTFELNFVRYRNAVREMTYKRIDIPDMEAQLKRARAQQRFLHENPDQAVALPSKTCTYCPLAMDFSCPIGEFNEYTTLSLPDRVKWMEWMRRMGAVNRKILKEWSEVRGAVTYEDGHGRKYQYGEQTVEETRLPLDQSFLKIIDSWKDISGEDLLDGRLAVSQTKVKSYAKAKKREGLRKMLDDSCYERGTKPKYAVRTPDEGVQTDEYNEWGNEEGY